MPSPSNWNGKSMIPQASASISNPFATTKGAYKKKI